jgi:hypothetical protein
MNFVIRVQSFSSSCDRARRCASHHIVAYVDGFHSSLCVTWLLYVMSPYACQRVSVSLLVTGWSLWYSMEMIDGI